VAILMSCMPFVSMPHKHYRQYTNVNEIQSKKLKKKGKNWLIELSYFLKLLAVSACQCLCRV